MKSTDKKEEDTYAMWSNESGITCFGVLHEHKNQDRILIVENPVSMVFYIPSGESTLKWDIIPFVFPAIIDNSKNIWNVKYSALCSSTSFNETLIINYKTFIMASSSPKSDNEVK